MSKIYTRNGDSGFTGTLIIHNGLSKASPIFELLGLLDELNVYLGSVDDEYCKDIQKLMLHISNHIQGYDYKANTDIILKDMEDKIDELDNQLPSGNKFILPGSDPIEQKYHKCRLVTRKIERVILTFSNVNVGVFKILNRLSDYFFMVSRIYNNGENTFLGLPNHFK